MRWLVLVLVAGNAIADQKCDREKLAPRNAEQILADARDAYVQGRYQDAIEIVKAALKRQILIERMPPLLRLPQAKPRRTFDDGIGVDPGLTLR
jgi:hypothetical protein